MAIHITLQRRGDGGFLAECTDLPGCRSYGSTEREARRKLREAVCGYVASVTNFVPRGLDEAMAPQVPAGAGAAAPIAALRARSDCARTCTTD